jgi:hypothetical protein
MKMKSGPRAEAGKQKSSRGDGDLEVLIGSLFAELSAAYRKSMTLSEATRSRGHIRASDEAFEIAILLKNALRVCGDALSHLP